jgi:hydrogenase small subunit
VRAGYYEEGVFAKHAGDKECLVDIGCWGPVVQCNITERGAINHMGGCMVAGGACIGCTMPGFPDAYSPFYKRPPGSALSGGVSRTYGAGIRRLRRMTLRGGNREPLWDRTGEVPSPWSAEHSEPSMGARIGKFFYHRLQYSGSVDQDKRNKQQPVPKSLNILQHQPEPIAGYQPSEPDKEEGVTPAEES